MSGREGDEQADDALEEDEEGDEEELEGKWELDPTDPTHPDYDLSTDAGYADWEPAEQPLFLRRRPIMIISILIIIGLLIPLLARLY